jgi:hypothetical protein
MNKSIIKSLPPLHSSLHSSRRDFPQSILLTHSLYDRKIEARSCERKPVKIDVLNIHGYNHILPD